jgi:hypothetical protein
MNNPSAEEDIMSGSFIDDFRDLPNFNVIPSSGSAAQSQGSLEDGAAPRKETRPTFPCESCAGTGFYRGTRVHQEKAHCFACKGRGYFLTSTKDRLAQKQASAQRKQNAHDAAVDAFEKAHPTLIAGLRSLASWNNLAASFLAQFDAKASLSDRQIEVAYAQIEKAKQRDAERAVKRESEKVAVDASRIHALFNKALESGLKKPGLWLGDVKLSLAGESSANAGAIYVKKGGEYQGKIKDGKFQPIFTSDKSIPQLLLDVSSNPVETLRALGKVTNKCCCCGRTLSDPASVEAGIGPICAGNWGV